MRFAARRQFDNLARRAPIHRHMRRAHSLGGSRAPAWFSGLTVGYEIAWICAPSLSARLSGRTLTMIENGAHNVDFGADRFGFRDLAGINWNLGAPQLYEHALQRNEARIAAHGPLVADTGAHTGRSPKDKFVVRDAEHRGQGLVGQQQCDDGRAFRRSPRRLPRPCQRQDAVRSGSLRRRRSSVAHTRPRLHRIRLALALHPQSPDPSASGGAGAVRPRADDRRSAFVSRRPQAASGREARRSSPAISRARSCSSAARAMRAR